MNWSDAVAFDRQRRLHESDGAARLRALNENGKALFADEMPLREYLNGLQTESVGLVAIVGLLFERLQRAEARIAAMESNQ